MLRRDFMKIGGAGIMALPLRNWPLPEALAGEPREEILWIHGSPYARHPGLRSHSGETTPSETWAAIVHFRTAEPYRRRILFGL